MTTPQEREASPVPLSGASIGTGMVSRNRSPVMGDVEAAIWEELTTNCTNYVYPPNERHPLSGPRLYAYAMYGPAVVDKLSQAKVLTLSGARGQLLPHEHALTLKQQVRDLLCEVYLSSPMLLTESEIGDLMQGRGGLFDEALRVTPVELRTILEQVRTQACPVPGARASDAKAIRSKVFTAISSAIQKFRSEKVHALQSASPQEEAVIKDTSITKRRTLLLYNQPQPKAYAIETWDTQDVSRAMHRNTCKISNIADASNSNICDNVRCLRPEMEYDGSKEAWDPYCCLRKGKTLK